MAPKRKLNAHNVPSPEAFTPERFEKELKNLAAKAKEDTWSNYVVEQFTVSFKTLALLALMALSSTVSQLSLSPVYGSIPASIWHSKVVTAGCFVGWSANIVLARKLPVKPILLLPLIALYTPYIQFYLFQLSGVFSATWGPLITESVTLFPLVALSATCIANLLEDLDLPPQLPSFIKDALPGIGSWALLRLFEGYSEAYVASNAGKSFFQTRIGLQLVLGASYSILAPSRLLAFAVPALLHTALFNTHVPTSWALAALQKTLPDGWVVLDRAESLTGYVSVIESLNDGIRVLRCDHSLLGGEWVKMAAEKVAEPIYGVFAMLEAVRLVNVPHPVPDSIATALVIGLGIGTTPAALVAHGIKTTVVEIDPVVHRFAQTYFQLPTNHTPIIEDAVSYTARLAKEANTQFDYIVHDVFTGGAEPVPLFTLEFLQGLDALLKPEGVIAINYAGDFLLPSPKVVVQTVKEVFPSCRLFRESPRPSEEEILKDGQDFTNMVIFCRKVSKDITFRKATRADYLGSRAREMFLVPEHQVEDSHFTKGDEGILTANDTQKVVKWHETSARGHWAVMRTVIPPKVWEGW